MRRRMLTEVAIGGGAVSQQGAQHPQRRGSACRRRAHPGPLSVGCPTLPALLVFSHLMASLACRTAACGACRCLLLPPCLQGALPVLWLQIWTPAVPLERQPGL